MAQLYEQIRNKLLEAKENISANRTWLGTKLGREAIQLAGTNDDFTIADVVGIRNELADLFFHARLFEEAQSLDGDIEAELVDLSDAEEKEGFQELLEIRQSGYPQTAESSDNSSDRASVFKKDFNFPAQSLMEQSIPQFHQRPEQPTHSFQPGSPKAAESPMKSVEIPRNLELSESTSKPKDDLQGGGLDSVDSTGTQDNTTSISEFLSNDLNTLEGKADEWFSHLTTKTHPFIRGEREKFQKEGYVKVRIAILDTGFANKTAQDKQKTQMFSAKVKKCLSFLPGADGNTDGEGHGTNVAYQLSRVCPNAQIYSFRVASRVQNRLEADQGAVVSAIEAAIREEVDIINMSFGWEYEYSNVESALETAQKQGILLFASVSNFGALSVNNILYPARSKFVIPVDAADGLGDPAPTHSSTEIGEILRRYTAPGRAVKGVGNTRVNGTSFASPIAAGISALVLEFARQTPLGRDAEIFRYLKRKEGMMRILALMQIQKTGAKFYFLRPWDLLSDIKGTFGGDGESNSKRFSVARHIIEALRSNYGHEVGETILEDAVVAKK
ncbi:peptidase S8/S53 domain-containing protein [Lophiotrema nucula]|uniref:Peptidase S8/S53 domain-containing protein n=1 Tax=Lophiotrema nucula TaxID=690887 RepID=A0A6A5YLW6_9PLEO|nr:peptidase S8/S53 domain-containing protein [Lophiotrema nucula]